MNARIRVSWLHPGKIGRQYQVKSLMFSKKYAKGRFCDIGCSWQPYRQVFADVIDDYIGLDLSASKSASGRIKKVDLFATALGLPFKSESFDTVLCTAVLEHVPEPDTAFAEISRVLKREGVLIITTPQTWGLHGEPYDYYRYTKYGLKHLAEKNGFDVEHIHPRGGSLATIGQLLSSFIFGSLVGYNRSSVGWSLVLQAPARLICMMIQILFYALDRICPAGSNTLGHLLIAKKK
jgi:SAM-dependent methyltransferase